MPIDYKAAVTIQANFQGQQALNQAQNAIEKLGRATGGISSTFDEFSKAARVLGGAFVLREVAQFAKGIIDMNDSLNDLRQKTGIAIQDLSDLRAAAEDGGIEFGTLESSLKKFSVTQASANAGNKEFAKVFKALGVDSLKPTGALILDIADKISTYADGAEKAAIMVKLFGKNGADLIPAFNGGSEAIRGLGEKITDDFARQSDKFNDNLNKLKRNFRDFGGGLVNEVLPALNKFLEALNSEKFQKTAKFLFQFRGSKQIYDDLQAEKAQKIAASEAALKGGDLGKGVFGPPKAPAPKVEDDKAKEKLESFVQQIERFKIAQEGKIKLEREALNLEGLSIDALKEREALTKLNTEAQKISSGWSKESAVRQKELNEELKKVTESIRQQEAETRRLAEAQKASFGEGANRAFRSYLENAKDVASQTEKLFSGAFNRIEDSLVEFVKTGKLNFADLADFIETELIRIAIRQAVVGVVSAVGGVPFADGGIMTSNGPMPLHKYASGGVARSPQLAMFGEGSTPEAFVPLPDGRSIPVSMKNGNAGSTSVQVNVSIDNSGATVSDPSAQDAQGKNLGKAIANAVRAELLQQQRQGGILYG